MKQRLLHSLLASALTCSAADLANHVQSEWITFRYDSSRVLFYVCNSMATGLAIQPQHHYPDPVARWGRGGYLIDAPADTLQNGNCKTEMHAVQLNDEVGIRLDGSSSVHAVVEKYVAQWGASAPDVQVGVIAKVTPGDLGRFRAPKANYFAAHAGDPLIAQDLQRLDVPIHGKRYELANLGSAGRILLFRGDAGWVVAICKKESGSLLPTAIRYAYRE